MPLHAAFLALAAFGGAALNGTDEFYGFRTPDHAVYCQMEFSQRGFSSFRCWTPNDGFWIRLMDVQGHSVRISKGYSPRYKGYRNESARLLPFGRTWLSSDAAIITCWSRRSGLTCKHYEGLSFWLGRFKGYRIYYDAPGFRPNVRPLFRTSHGIWCGINRETLEPANPVLLCWQPSSGLQLAVAHDTAGGGGDSSRREKAKGYRPSGFPLLPDGRDWYWRCQTVSRSYAEGCPARGSIVFSCNNRVRALTCKNQNGRGFWVSRNSFYTF